VPNQIPFSSILIEELGDVLVQANFKLTQLDVQSIERIVYERQGDISSNPQEIIFGGGEDSANHIYVFASSGKPNINLPTLKELLPNFRSIPGREQNRWSYSDEVELRECISQIAELIEFRLFDWFEKPVFNPAKVPNPFTNQQLKEKAESFRKMAEELRKLGQDAEADGYQKNFEIIKRKLEDENEW
jgi:hypothetical protein